MIDLKEFATASLALNKKAFVVHVAYLGSKMSVYSACKAQIALLLAKNVSVLKEYIDFSNIFSKKSVAVLLN